jgi:hypothetical protein
MLELGSDDHAVNFLCHDLHDLYGDFLYYYLYCWFVGSFVFVEQCSWKEWRVKALAAPESRIGFVINIALTK